jgi:hypothetical protein
MLAHPSQVPVRRSLPRVFAFFRSAAVLVVAALTPALGAEPARDTAVLPVDAARGEFTVVLLPDTQRYAKHNPAMFLSQTRWIRENVAALAIRFVIHLGDIVDDNTDAEWRVADEAMGLLDGVVPYTVLPGNHDFEKSEDGQRRVKLAPKYNAVFPPRRFRHQPGYGGHRGVTNENNYSFFSAGGRNFLVLALEFGPSDEVLEWAAGIVRQHADKQVLLATHAYMYDDDTRLGPGDDYSPHKSDLKYNDGEQIWEKFVRRHSNICIVVSGHVKGEGVGRLSSRGDHGNVVHQMLSDYQHLPSGGDGWLRLLKFVPAGKKLVVRTYSPWLQKFHDHPRQSFELELNQNF